MQGDLNMVSPGSNFHSFIVRLWSEADGEEPTRFFWRGYITHVPSETRRYLRDLNEIVSFIATCLEAEERDPGWWRRREEAGDEPLP